VLYPIVALAERGLGVERFVWMLEEIMLEIAAATGVHAHRDDRGRGVWTARGKLGAVGIRVRDGVSLHGLALNVSLDLAGFDLIAPCGTRGLAVTSLVAEGAPVGVLEVLPAAERACARWFGGAAARGVAGAPTWHEVRL
jgi:lipoate-protein ligase B